MHIRWLVQTGINGGIGRRAHTVCWMRCQGTSLSFTLAYSVEILLIHFIIKQMNQSVEKNVQTNKMYIV